MSVGSDTRNQRSMIYFHGLLYTPLITQAIRHLTQCKGRVLWPKHAQLK